MFRAWRWRLSGRPLQHTADFDATINMASLDGGHYHYYLT